MDRQALIERLLLELGESALADLFTESALADLFNYYRETTTSISRTYSADFL